MKKLILLIFLIFPSIGIGADSTTPILPPTTIRQCFTVTVTGFKLNPRPRDISTTLIIEEKNCILKGDTRKSYWLTSGVNATYEEVCDADEIMVAVQHHMG